MTDKAAPQAVDNSTGNAQRPTANGDGTGVAGDQRQGIFDERFAALTDGFGQACEQAKVTTAVAIAIHPDEKQPIVFVRGHNYDIAVLLASILRSLKADLYARLDAEPGMNELPES